MAPIKSKHPVRIILGVYLLCFLVRLVEYLWIRTDQTAIGEAFLHKTFGVLLLFAVLRALRLRWSDIGFRRQTAVRHTLWGLLLGAGTFAAAYAAEWLVLAAQGHSPALRFAISSYSITGNTVLQTSLLFFLICMAGNILNVVMEEGIFRGLFLQLGAAKTSFWKATMAVSLLFGLWHIAAPLRELYDGRMAVGPALLAAILQILLTGVMGLQLCLLVKLSGSLWVAMAVHFFNNFIVNILHVVTATGMDTLQGLRISVAQTLSFLVVLLLLWRQSAWQNRQYSKPRDLPPR